MLEKLGLVDVPSGAIRDHGRCVAQAEPSAVGGIDRAAQFSGSQVHARRAVALEVYPTNIRRVSNPRRFAWQWEVARLAPRPHPDRSARGTTSTQYHAVLAPLDLTNRQFTASRHWRTMAVSLCGGYGFWR